MFSWLSSVSFIISLSTCFMFKILDEIYLFCSYNKHVYLLWTLVAGDSNRSWNCCFQGGLNCNIKVVCSYIIFLLMFWLYIFNYIYIVWEVTHQILQSCSMYGLMFNSWNEIHILSFSIWNLWMLSHRNRMEKAAAVYLVLNFALLSLECCCLTITISYKNKVDLILMHSW